MDKHIQDTQLHFLLIIPRILYIEHSPKLSLDAQLLKSGNGFSGDIPVCNFLVVACIFYWLYLDSN